MNIDYPWGPGEAAAVNEFLNSDVGRRWLGFLLVRKPRMDLSTSERAGLSGALAAGYEQVFAEIAASRIAQRPPEDYSAKAIDPTKD